MYYKIIILVIITLFIGANLLCGCCRYPVFDMITGKSSCSASSASEATNVKEGLLDKKDPGPPGSTQSVNQANSDITAINSSKQQVPAIVAATATVNDKEKKAGFMNIGDIGSVINTALGGNSGSSSGAQPRQGFISSTTKEGMDTMGSDINEVQNGDVAGMWVTKANTYASEFGYGIINNSGASYTADELVMFAKNKSKPECCPSPYSTSSGCICMTPEQINYLNTRGGNRTSDSGV
jgi:hypothetical protein